MECNKDEAIRAKDIAVKKFTANDYMGAKKFALKAQTLYPALEGISHLLTTLDVYICADKRTSGEIDYYGILHVNPLADDEIIKKQYRRLVLQLHPDKNKSVGADGAFQLVTEAFDVLSDKTKRSAYNTRRHIKIAQKVPQPQPTSGRPVDLKAPAGGVPVNPFCNATPFQDPADGVHWYRKRPGATSSRVKAKKCKTQNDPPAAKPFVPDNNTFWTVCGRCKMQYEYMRIYLRQLLKCPSCHVGFFAAEVPMPSNIAPPKTHASGKVNSSKGASARWTPLSGQRKPGKKSC